MKKWKKITAVKCPYEEILCAWKGNKKLQEAHCWFCKRNTENKKSEE